MRSSKIFDIPLKLSCISFKMFKERLKAHMLI